MAFNIACSLGEIGDLGSDFSFNCAALAMITAADAKSEVKSMGRIMQSKDRECGHHTLNSNFHFEKLKKVVQHSKSKLFVSHVFSLPVPK